MEGHVEGGRSSNNTKEKGVPGNQNVIEIDQDEREGMPLPYKASEVCHIDDDHDEVSPPSVRGKSPVGQSTTTW